MHTALSYYYYATLFCKLNKIGSSSIKHQKELFNFLICAIYCMEVDLAMINIKG